MLAQINIQLEGNSLNFNMGSLFHGYLMEHIDTAYADYFHYNTTNPFTSCIYKEKDKYFWRITTYNKKAYAMIIESLEQNMPEQIYIRHKDTAFNVVSYDIQETSFEDLFLSNTKCNRITLLTPTTFKSNGTNQIFPSISTLLSGVIEKINKHSDSIMLSDEKIISELLEKTYIKDYNLRTKIFNLEGIKIKGFIGTMDLSIKGDNTLSQLLNFLILSSQYTGLGRKTSLGMGGVKIWIFYFRR